MNTEASKNGGELDRDIAAALDEDRVRQGRQVEGLVGGDGQLCAGDRGNEGRSASRHQNVAGGQFAILPDEAH
ncbi:hypothetical protein D9M68_879740 [compost metagenome]